MTNTRERVPSHTDEHVNRRIRAAMKRTVHHYSLHREEIPRAGCANSMRSGTSSAQLRRMPPQLPSRALR